jgi:hypothetical protein
MDEAQAQDLLVVAAGGAHHLSGQGSGLAVLLRVLVLHGNSGSHQNLPEVGGEPHSREGEQGVSVDVILRSSRERQVSQAEGVHHVFLVDPGAQLRGAAQSTGHAVIPVEVTVVNGRTNFM